MTNFTTNRLLQHMLVKIVYITNIDNEGLEDHNFMVKTYIIEFP